VRASDRPGPQWWLRRHPELLAIPVAAFQLAVCYVAGRHQPKAEPLDALAVVLLVGSGLALAARRRYPVVVLAVTGAATVLYHALGYPNGPFVLALVVAIFGAVRRGHRMAVWIGAAVFYVSYLVLTRLVDRYENPQLGQALGVAAWLLVILVVADLVRVRRERVVDAARSRAEEERRRQSEERLRVARELHDVLAHNISLINVQAGVALHLIDERPEQARTALAAIKDASKDALGELRSVLGVLRAPDDDEAPRAPAPSLARLDGLVAQAAATGLAVELAVDGDPRPLPAPVDLAAFRIVQEALTNVTRHAGTARSAVVHVRYDADDVTVQIDDDGDAPARSGSTTVGTGSGIRGMRERAAALGGTLEAGPRLDGGFRVSATLPLEGVP
jgi:signal transduction histidine kinase